MNKTPIDQHHATDAVGRDRRVFIKTGLGVTAAVLGITAFAVMAGKG